MFLSIEMEFFILSILASQAIYFLFNIVLNWKIPWLSTTIGTIGLAFGLGFGFGNELYFWIGYATFIVAFCLMFYTMSEREFLGKKINSILRHPKLLDPYG